MRFACAIVIAAGLLFHELALAQGSSHALLAVERQRASIVQRIVGDWQSAAQRGATRRSQSELGEALWRLRADELLVASLAGDFATIEHLIQSSDLAPRPGRRDAMPKALGDALTDMAYTPVAPCRIVDTRFAGGPLQPGVTRHFIGLGQGAAGFSGQGGVAATCGVPAGVAALVLNLHALEPAEGGYLKLWQANVAEPYATSLLFDAGTAGVSIGTIVPVDGASANGFDAASIASVQLVVDVVGFLRAPATIALPNLRISPISDPSVGATANVTIGAASNRIDAGVGSTIGGGGCAGGTNCTPAEANVIAGNFGTIAGGRGGSVQGEYSTIGGGYRNSASGFAATVAGGSNNNASGSFSFAAGTYAAPEHSGCFVFADASEPFPVFCGAPHRAVLRVTGGMAIRTSSTAVVELAPGATAWTTLSDRESKDNLERVDPRDILERLVSVPVYTWNWKTQSASIRHIGPTAQDFAAAFAVGETPNGISTVDADGVALAAIQGVYRVLQERDAMIRSQGQELEALRARLEALERSMRDR